MSLFGGPDFDARSDEELDNASLLSNIAQNLSSNEQTGPPVSEHLAKIVNSKLSEEVDLAKLKETLGKYKRPENCTEMYVPKVNQEIWQKMKPYAKRTDIKMANLQDTIMKGLLACLTVLMNCYSAGKLKQSPIIEILYHSYLIQLLFWAMCAESCPLNEKRPLGLFCIQILSHYAQKTTKLDHYCLGRIWQKQPKTYCSSAKNNFNKRYHAQGPSQPSKRFFYLRGRGHSFLPENPNTTYNGKHLQKNYKH